LSFFAHQSPSIVVTDWMLPDLSGLDLCQRIRSDASNGYTYEILLTSMSDKENIVLGLEAGADDYLTKPFDPDELKARLGAGRRIVGLYREINAKSRQIEQCARVDQLTGLPNGRALEEWATWQLKSSARHGFPLWLVLAGVDSLQMINETCGRETADGILKDFAQILRDVSGESDVCGRMDGGEFVSVLTHLPKADVLAVIEGYRRRLQERTFVFNKQNVTVTASFGAAAFGTRDAQDFGGLLRKASDALAAARLVGGNAIKTAG
jgi:two-component system, cell cycle response regulator